MTIGLLGGSFDPPHAGHLHISLLALKRLGLDRLWWLVTPANPLKSDAARQSFAHRLGMASETARHPRIDVTGFEAALPNAYTVNTIRFVQTRFPAVAFVWVMGADNLVGFHHWQGWEEIVARVPIAVMDRPGYRHQACRALAARAFASSAIDASDAGRLVHMTPPAWSLLTGPMVAVSSTEIRARRGVGDSESY